MAEKNEKDAEEKPKISKKILIIRGSADLNKKLKTDESFATKYLEGFCAKNEPAAEEVEEVIYVHAESPDHEENVDSSSLDDVMKGKALQEYEDDISDLEEKRSGKGSPSADQDADGSNIWSDTSINLLLEEYKKRIDHFRDRNFKKVPLWREIGAVFKKKNKSFGPMTIYTKFRNMKSTYRKIKLNELLKTSGAGCRWQWTKEMDEIFHDDESFNFSSDSIFSHKLHDHTQFIRLSSSHHKSNVGQKQYEGEKQYAGQKRQDYLEWNEYFMATALLAAKRSKDPTCQVGACIVNKDKVIVGIGYNGMPKHCHDDEFPWSKRSHDVLDNKYMYVCHAELNAILNKNSTDVKDCTMYVGLFPCNECAKVMIQAGIKEIVYMSDKHAHKKSTIGSKRMFDAAGVTYKQFIPKRKTVSIDFSEIDWNTMDQLPPTPIKQDKKRSAEESDDQQ